MKPSFNISDFDCREWATPQLEQYQRDNLTQLIDWMTKKKDGLCALAVIHACDVAFEIVYPEYGSQDVGVFKIDLRYQFLPQGVSCCLSEEFRLVPAADRCAHCCDRFTPMMNGRRKLKGIPLYKDAMTKELA